MNTRLSLVGSCLVLFACGATAGSATDSPKTLDPANGDETGTGDVDSDGDGKPDPKPGTSRIAAGLAISEIAIFQAVKIPLAKDGKKATTRAAPVVANRPGLIRVYVKPLEGYQARAITAELQLVSGGTKLPVLTDTKTLKAASTDATLASTFNFEVPATSMPADVSYEVSLRDPVGTEDGDPSKARYPASGEPEAIGAKSSGKQLKVKLVPVKYNADQSGRLPDTQPSQVAAYKNAFYSMYPAADVEVTVREPYETSTAIQANGRGFGTVLQAMVRLRQQDKAPKDVYYMGIFEPTDSFSTFCRAGCVLGLSGLVENPNDAVQRASVGIGFSGSQSPDTAVHEIGHAHGRPHAPCGGADGVDSAYPYDGGAIGSWGYSLITKKLLSPTANKDFMGYCAPTWVSDYNYQELFDRMVYVNGATSLNVPVKFDTPQKYRVMNIEPDGSANWGDTMELIDRPFNDPKTVTYLGADGQTVQTATGHFYSYPDLGGGYLLVPEAAARVSRVRVEGLAGIAKTGVAELARPF